MREKLVSAVIAAVLLALGVTACASGVRAIRARAYDFSWRPARGSQITFIDHYRKAAAVRVGVGLVAIGVFLGTFATAVVVGVWQSHRDWTTGVLGRGLLWSATASSLIGVLSLFPPWEVQSLPFYAVPLAVLIACSFFHRTRWTGMLLAVIGALVLATATAMNAFNDYQTASRWAGELVLGIFATVVGAALRAWWASQRRRQSRTPI
ncbi:MAG: hypothetical protein ACM3U2_08360 [Deltaproteobacteria bacterium]